MKQNHNSELMQEVLEQIFGPDYVYSVQTEARMKNEDIAKLDP